MFRSVFKRKDTHVNNVTLGFYYGGSIDQKDGLPTHQVPCLHTNINVLQVRQASNVYESENKFKQFYQYLVEMDLGSTGNSVYSVDEFEVTWPKDWS